MNSEIKQNHIDSDLEALVLLDMLFKESDNGQTHRICSEDFSGNPAADIYVKDNETDLEFTIVIRGPVNRLEAVAEYYLNKANLLPSNVIFNTATFASDDVSVMVHSGMNMISTPLTLKIFDIVSSYDKISSVRIYGYGIGGAMAYHAAARLAMGIKNSCHVRDVITFGTTRPGNSEYATNWMKSVHPQRCDHYVSKLDPLPFLPLLVFGARHIGRRLYLTSKGTVTTGLMDMIIDRIELALHNLKDFKFSNALRWGTIDEYKNSLGHAAMNKIRQGNDD